MCAILLGFLAAGSALADIEVIITEDGNSQCRLVTFEGVEITQLIYPEGDGLIPGSGIRFVVEDYWLALTNGLFANNPSGTTVAFFGGPMDSGSITFDDLVHSVSFYYASEVPVTVDAFDANGALVASTSGPANALPTFPTFGAWDLLSVEAGDDVIASVTVAGALGRTGIDDFAVCLTIGPPEPEDVIDEVEQLVETGDLSGGRPMR